MADLGVDDIGAFDLYSCFPSVVELTLDTLGTDRFDERPLTLTGGLPYHGGAGNNYVTHAVANTLAQLPDGRHRSVLVHGNGYFATKHAVGVYTSSPSGDANRPGDVQHEVDALAAPVPVAAAMAGTAAIVAATVPFTRSGETKPGIVLVEKDGTRSLATADEDLTASLLSEDAVGRSVDV